MNQPRRTYVLALIAACGAVVVAGCGDNARESQFARLRSGERDTFYPYSPEDIQCLLRTPDVAVRVKHVQFSDVDVSKGGYSALVDLPNVITVSLYSTSGSDSFASTIASMRTVQGVVCSETDLSDVGVQRLSEASLTELALRVSGGRISDNAIAELQKRHPSCNVTIIRDND